MEFRLFETRTGEKENLRINKARGKKLEMHWCVIEFKYHGPRVFLHKMVTMPVERIILSGQVRTRYYGTFNGMFLKN